jgi:putative flippase GtrA
VTFNRFIVLFLLLMASAWAALINGQPFFMDDSTAYVRGPDLAAVYFLGPKFATVWTQRHPLQGLDLSQTNKNSVAPTTREVTPTNSSFDSKILAGRSVYYGALLYVSHLTSHLWLAVFVQAAIFLYLTYTLAIKCLRLTFFVFTCITATLLVATSISFFISVLMPDVFASFLILGLATLVVFWDSLKFHDRAFLSVIILYSALTHTSHLLLLIGVGSIIALICIITQRKALLSGSLAMRVMLLVTIIFAAIIGDLAVSFSVRHTIGVDPIRPPFLTARIIADGPGYQFLQNNCARKHYAVCKYIDHLPVSSLVFLWSKDPETGVFDVADPSTRHALSSEQASFVFDVFRSDPIGVLTSAAKNFTHQLLAIGFDEFALNQEELQGFKAKLPESYFAGLSRARIQLNSSILVPLEIWYSSIYFLSMTALLLMWAFWSRGRFQKRLDASLHRQWFYVLTIVIASILINAAICGILSEPVPRYQTRISWLPLIILALVIACLWETLSPANREIDIARRLAERLPRAFRFLGIGSIGLASDLASFTIIAALGAHVLIARLGSVAIATMVTWRLNRALTFDPSGRRQHEEAVRYAIVTVIAQGTSYAIFAVLVLTVLSTLPQVAILIGAVIGAVLSYNGHRLLSFAPKAIYSPP